MIATIEIPKGSYLKYEQDKTTGRMLVDRVLSIPYPHNYGFALGTISEDGDPLDVFVLSEFPIASNTDVGVELIGMLFCEDGGVADHKLVGKIAGAPTYVRGWEETLTGFLQAYKPGFRVLATGTLAEALEEYRKARMKGMKHEFGFE